MQQQKKETPLWAYVFVAALLAVIFGLPAVDLSWFKPVWVSVLLLLTGVVCLGATATEEKEASKKLVVNGRVKTRPTEKVRLATRKELVGSLVSLGVLWWLTWIFW